VCTKSLSESAFTFDVQIDFAMIDNEDAKDKLSAINDFVDYAVIGRTLIIVLIEKVKVCDWTINLQFMRTDQLQRFILV
jgi:hypothetical protein